MASDRPILIYGAGAVGGYLAGTLEAGGERVALVARPRIAEAVERHGLVLRELGVERISHPEIAREDINPRLTILTIRAYDVEAALPDLRRLIGSDGLILAMQNGAGSEDLLADALGRERVLAGTLTVSAGMEEPGIITRYSRQGGLAV